MKRILVPADLVAVCFEKGKNAELSYGKRSQDRLFSKGNIPLVLRIDEHVIGYLAEAALCLFLSVDPRKALTWNTTRPDVGYDLEVEGTTIDVKASANPSAQRLMLPVEKNTNLDDMADVFVFARVRYERISTIPQLVQLVGWTTRKEFAAKHSVANGVGGIVDGTRYMHEKQLYMMADLCNHLHNKEETA